MRWWRSIRGRAVAEQLALTPTALGMTFAGKVSVMLCDAAHLPMVNTGAYQIKPVTTAAEQASVCDILADAFGFSRAALQPALDVTQLDEPGLTVYLAYQDEQPISTVATTVAGPMVSIWSIGALPAYQRKGSGRALLGQVMAQQQARGANALAIKASISGVVTDLAGNLIPGFGITVYQDADGDGFRQCALSTLPGAM